MTTVWSLLYLAVLTALFFHIATEHHAETGTARFLGAFVVVFAIFFGSFFVLGILELLSGQRIVVVPAVALVGLCAAAAYWLSTRRGQPGRFMSAAIAADRREVSTVESHDHGDTNGKIPGRMVIITVMAFAVLTALTLFGFPRGFEGNTKHLPMAVHIFQSGSLMFWDITPSHTVPANMSIFLGYFLNFVPERLVGILNVLFLPPLVLAIYGTSRAVGADNGASLWAALGILTVPLVAFNAFETQADIAGLAFLACAVYFAIRKPKTRPSWPVLAGLAAGMAVGCKVLHLMGATFIGAVIALEWYSSHHAHRFRDVAADLAKYTAAAFAMTAFWFSRGYIELGNPLYPFDVPFAELLGWEVGTKTFSGSRNQLEWVRSSAEWFVYPWVEWHYISRNFEMSAGLGAFFAATIPIALLTSAAGAVAAIVRFLLGRPRRPRHAMLARGWPNTAILLGGALVLLVFWWHTGRQPRYAMGAFAFLFPLVAWTIGQTHGRARKAYDCLLALCALAMLAVVSSKVLVEFGDRIVFSKQYTRSAFYEYPPVIDTLPKGATILNLGKRPFNYALFGRSHANRVVSSREAARLFGQAVAVSNGQVAAVPTEAAQSYQLHTPLLREIGATHAFVVGQPPIELDGCARFQEIGRWDVNPVNQVPLAEPRIVYEIIYCAGSGNNGS